jgi:hypothetical protein
MKLPEGTHYEIGRYGRMRGEYLNTYRRGDCVERACICVMIGSGKPLLIC